MRKRKIYTMSELSAALMSAFNKINDDWFGGELEKVIITFESGYKKGAYGWIRTVKDWEQNGNARYNINISSDYLGRGVVPVIGTLVHEMCHLYNLQHEIKDTSRAGIYHNTKFRDCATNHGLDCEEIDKAGWARTTPTDDLVKWIAANINIQSFELHKLIIEKPKEDKPKQSQRKYICPSCGLIIRATKDCRVSCLDCECEMEKEN